MKQDSYNDKFVTGVIVLLATILTTVSLAMIAVAASERSSNLTETILIALLSGSIALSAHLLPALTRKRVGKKSGFLVAIIWLFSVLVTLYSHTVFFISTTSNAGDARAERSVEVKDIEKIALQNQQIAQATKSRSIIDITNNKLEVEKSIIDLNRRNCEKCKTTQSRLQQRQAELQALNVELDEAKKAEVSRNKVLSLNEQALKVKNGEKLDPVTEKLSLIFKGFNVDAMTLFISVVSAALLEALASLFWWLVWPNRNVHSKINMNNFINNNDENDNSNKEIPLDRKIKHSMRKEISLLEERMKSNLETGENKILNFLELKLSNIENNYFKLAGADENEKLETPPISTEEEVQSTIEEIEKSPALVKEGNKPLVELEKHPVEEVKPTVESEETPVSVEEIKPTIELEETPVSVEEEVQPTIELEETPVSVEEEVKPTIELEETPVSVEEEVKPTIELEETPVSVEEEVKPTIELEETPVSVEEEVQPTVETEKAIVLVKEEVNSPVEVKEESIIEKNDTVNTIESIFADFDDAEIVLKKENSEEIKEKVIIPIKDPEINPLIENPLLELDIPDFLNKALTHDKLANLRINN